MTKNCRFKATARRNKLLGLWAAEKLGMTGAEADSYAKSIVMADFEEPGDHDVPGKIRKDFDDKGVGAVRSPDRPRHVGVDGQGGRRHQGGQLAEQPSPQSLQREHHGHFRLHPRPTLRAGETVFSGWCSLPYPIVAETLGREGFPAVTIEGQHGLWDVSAMLTGIAAVRQGGAAPVVRVPVGDFATVSRALDFGAEGIIAPMINTSPTRAPLPPRPNIRRSASGAGDRIARPRWPACPINRSICAKPTITSLRWR